MLMNFICGHPVVWVMVMAMLIAIIGYFLKEECSEDVMYEEAINDLMDYYNDPDGRYIDDEEV